MKLAVANWAEFQHYKDRCPPWIKLHKELLDDRVFQRLPDASRALAPCLWLLASESKDGIFDGSTEEVAFRVRQSEQWVDKAIKPLISSGFFIVVQDAGKPLAERQQVAVPEAEAEAEAEAEQKARSPKGSRLQLETLPLEWSEFCFAERADLDALKTFAGFRDYWIAAPGSKGVKADWFATWRNWVRNQKTSIGSKKSGSIESRNAAAVAAWEPPEVTNAAH